MQTDLTPWALLGILIFGFAALAYFYLNGGKPAGGVSKLSIRAVGIIFVLVAATALAIIYESAVVAAVGLLGAVAGYLFGAPSAGGSSESSANVGDVSGDNARIAGRDLVEKQLVDRLESLNTTIQQFASTAPASGGAHGMHVHEERVSRAGEWAYSPDGLSSIVQAYERALSRFPAPDFVLVSSAWSDVSDYAHVVFVFRAHAYPAGEIRSTLNTP